MKSKLNKPNLFIIGAPRSGTTSLYNYLTQHPDIFMSKYKEPHYFATDIKAVNPWSEKMQDTDVYLKLFNGADEKKRIGTASVLYMISKTAAKRIRKFAPDSKIIAMLRSPVEVMYSLYYQLYFGGDEPIGDFERALEAQEFRKKHGAPKSDFVIKEFYFYKDIVKYADQLQRYYDQFPRSQIKVILFDDFKRDTAKVYREILEFLEVDPNFVPKFEIANANVQLTNPSARKKMTALAKQVSRLGIFPFLILRPLYFAFQRLITRKVVRPRIDTGLEKRLKSEQKQSVQKLERMLGKDLSDWYN